jgi:two-component system NtrC family response regulator
MVETMRRTKLLIVEDDPDIREQMKWALEPPYEILQAGDRTEALARFRAEAPPLVVLDLGLPPDVDQTTEGLQALEEILAADATAKVVIVTGDSNRTHALRAIQIGAYDYIQKPVEIEILKLILGRAAYLAQLEEDNRALAERPPLRSYENMVGSSPQMQKVFETIRRVGQSDIPVLILGESGTGKELVARALHKQGHEESAPFVAINCSAIPEALLESELFGHEKGAFTGAHEQRKGKIELADGGTLFLDEIGELPAVLQAKLLRVLQEHEIERIGGRTSIKVQTRVVSATNVDIEKAVAAGRFREDLYYRLCGITIKLPALRDRAGDIEILAATILRRCVAASNKKVTGFTKSALRAMELHQWPGNIRELENRIRRAVVMAQGRLVTPEDLELIATAGRYHGLTLKAAREALERDMLEAALARHNGNISRVAQELSLSRPTLYAMMAKLNLGHSSSEVTRES